MPIGTAFQHRIALRGTIVAVHGLLTSIHENLLIYCHPDECCGNRARGYMLVSDVLAPTSSSPLLLLGAPESRTPFDCTHMCCGFEQGDWVVIRGRLQRPPMSDEGYFIADPELCRAAALVTTPTGGADPESSVEGH